jgi:ABC-type phosphate transport system substrate-binding protein
VFSVLVNTLAGSPFAGTTNPVISSKVLRKIFASGTSGVTNWNQVPVGNGAYGPDLPIKVCRREPGSGTQAVAQQYFLGTAVCGAALTFKTDGGDLDDTNAAADTDGVIERSTGGGLNTCVSTVVGAIGFAGLPSAAPANSQIVAVDGAVPTKNSAALGGSSFLYESSLIVNPALGGDAADLANGIVAEAQKQNSTPVATNVVALPSSVNDPATGNSAGFSTTVAPVAYVTRNGNSCAPLTLY